MLIIMSCISLWHISLTGFYQVLRHSFRFLLQHHTTFSGPSMAVCVCFKVVLFVLLNVTLFRISPQIHRKEKCRDLSRYDPPTHKHTHIKKKKKTSYCSRDCTLFVFCIFLYFKLSWKEHVVCREQTQMQNSWDRGLAKNHSFYLLEKGLATKEKHTLGRKLHKWTRQRKNRNTKENKCNI